MVKNFFLGDRVDVVELGFEGRCLYKRDSVMRVFNRKYYICWK